jgi:hypothetical protein
MANLQMLLGLTMERRFDGSEGATLHLLVRSSWLEAEG